MKIFAALLLKATCLFVGVVQAQECPPAHLLSAITPAPPSSPSRYGSYLKSAADIPSDVSVLLIGDSFVQRWPVTALQEQLPKDIVYNYGNTGDMTQDVLWRLQDPKLRTVSPRAVVLSLGTNNLYTDREACGIVGGLVSVAKAVRELWPSTKVVVLGIPPRGMRFEMYDELRQKVNATFRSWLTAQGDVVWLQDDATITCGLYGKHWNWLDSLLSSAGLGPKRDNFLEDWWHPSAKGYEVFDAEILKALS